MCFMSSVSSVTASAPQVAAAKSAPVKPPTPRPTDGDTPAQEAAESNTTKRAEKQGGGFASNPTVTPPPSTGLVNKIA
jgi:hypothetical protein